MSRFSRVESVKQTYAFESIARAIQDLRRPSLDDPPWPSLCIPKPPGRCTHVLLPDGWHEVKQGENGYSEIMGSHGLFSFNTTTDGVRIEGPTSSLLAIKNELPKVSS